MKTLLNTLTLSLAIATSTAIAQEATLFEDDFESATTRAAVIDRVEAAIERGQRLSWGEARRLPVMPRRSTLTRADVRAGVMAALQRGDDLHFGDVDPAHNLLAPASAANAASRLAFAKR